MPLHPNFLERALFLTFNLGPAVVRGRVQRAIDRRFYRRKYDAARTLAGFAARVPDETDLERLNAQLVGVVEETMQPEEVALWLRPAARQERLRRKSGEVA